MKIYFLLLTLAVLFANSKCQSREEEEGEEENEEEKLDRIDTEWSLSLYDLIDYYDEVSDVSKEVLLGRSSYQEKISAELKYCKYLKNQSKYLAQIDEYDVPSRFENMRTFMLKPNKAALDDQDLKKSIQFTNSMTEMTSNNFIEDASRNLTYLKELWSDRLSNLTSGDFNFTEILLLNEKAAALNGDEDMVKYWEEMVQYSDGYNTAKTIWDELEPVYKKFHQFVLDRINYYYKTNFTNIPVYLTGSKFGEDWSSLADIILPHQQIHHDAVTSLKQKSKKTLYKHCNKVADELKLKPSKESFWKHSNFDFDSNCDSKIISFCSKEYSILLTCNKTTWTQYLNLQENAIEIGIKNFDYLSLPYRSLRESFFEQSLQSLGSSLAVHNLAYDSFVESDAFSTHQNATDNLMTARLLVALRVLPRLAYYYAVDNWRIAEVQNSSGNLIESWWEARERYQGVVGINGDEMDFLEDEYVVGNKPYLGKFLGNILQFSFLAILDFTSEDTPNLITQLIDRGFDSMISDLLQRDPRELIDYHFDIPDITHYDAKAYFDHLENYVDASPLEPLPFERHVLNKPRTTTGVPTSETSIVTEPSTRSEEPTVNDAPSTVETPRDDGDVPRKAEGYSVGIYILITASACVLIVVALFVFKMLVKMRRPRTNNRRFQA